VLDGVRGLAVCMVIIAHAAAPPLGLLPSFMSDRWGQQGVTLFFILSGFLMSHLYMRDTFVNTNVERYAAHRIGRVFPIYLLVVFASWASHPAWLKLYPIHTETELAEHALFYRGTDVLWTVPIEVQFYLVFAFLWWCAVRNRAIAGIGTMVAVELLDRLLKIGLGWQPPALFSWIHVFLFGVILGRLWHSGMRLKYPRLMVASLVPLFLLSSSVVRDAIRLPMLPTWWDPVLLAFPAMIFLCALFRLPPFGLLASSPMRWLGRISYSAYLFHNPILTTMTSLFPARGLWMSALVLIASLAITFGLAEFSFVLFETPIRRWINSLVKRRVKHPVPAA